MPPATSAEARRRIGAIGLPVRRLHLELTNRCNFACEFCPDARMQRGRGDMPLAQAERVLAEAGREGLAREAHFHLMGEPLLHPGLVQAVALARRHGLRACVTTNAGLLSPDLLGALRDAGLSHLTISLQTPDAATFGLRGTPALPFDRYRTRLVKAVHAHLAAPPGLQLTIGVLVNPLRRFGAPGAPPFRVAESGRALRADLSRWVEWLFRGTAHEPDIPRLLARVGGAGILKESRITLTAGLDFQVRVLGAWAEHFQCPVHPARFGYCPALQEHLGVLWNGDYVICCADYDGHTVLANAADTSLADYLGLPAVQAIAAGFRRYRVVHPHCARCLGDRRRVDSLIRGIGSILYFRWYRPLMAGRGAGRA
jgi:hypothetical protein